MSGANASPIGRSHQVMTAPTAMRMPSAISLRAQRSRKVGVNKMGTGTEFDQGRIETGRIVFRIRSQSPLCSDIFSYPASVHEHVFENGDDAVEKFRLDFTFVCKTAQRLLIELLQIR